MWSILEQACSACLTNAEIIIGFVPHKYVCPQVLETNAKVEDYGTGCAQDVYVWCTF